MALRPLCSTLFPYTTLFRSRPLSVRVGAGMAGLRFIPFAWGFLSGRPTFGSSVFALISRFASHQQACLEESVFWWRRPCSRSEEHTSELQSRENLVCRLLLE